MTSDKMQGRQRVRELAQQMLPKGDLTGFFNAVYETANGDSNGIPWADLQPHPLALDWLQAHQVQGAGRPALVVGCGLGDDAEELAARGFQVMAFDISSQAIAWCQKRFPNSPVTYQTADLLAPPASWQKAFDFILEIYTIQAMPPSLREHALASLAELLAEGGQLVVICRGRDEQDDPGTLPWPLTRSELATLTRAGLREVSFEDIRDEDGRHFRAVYTR